MDVGIEIVNFFRNLPSILEMEDRGILSADPDLNRDRSRRIGFSPLPRERSQQTFL